MGATDSTSEFYAAIRTRLLTYTDGGSAPNTINAATSGRLYSVSPPDPASNTTQAVPYVLLTISGLRANPDRDRARVNFSVEVQVVHQPRTKIPDALRIADLAFKALAGYQVGTSTDGAIVMGAPTLPLVLPAGGGDDDRTIVQVRVTCDGYAYWKSLVPVLT